MKATRQDSSQKKLSAFFSSKKENIKPKSTTEPCAVVVKEAQPPELQVERAQKQPSWWPRASSFGQSSTVNGAKKRQISQFVGGQSAKKSAPWSSSGISIAKRADSTPGPQKSTDKKLSEEQLKVLNRIVNGKSVFFTGAAGTGKSYLLHSIVESLRRRLSNDQVGVTATTGLAAVTIGGLTIHRWAGIGTGRDSVDKLTKGVLQRDEVVRRWRSCRVLIIDEVSMLEADLFDKLETIARNVRKNQQPFGGIQLVLTGDFFQLPPVSRDRTARLCFESEKWATVMEEQHLLRKVFRQKDQRLIDMLNCMRVGNLTKEVLENFEKLGRAVCYEDGLEATQLYPRRDQVERANQTRMQSLKGREFVFDALDSGTFDPAANERLLENVMAPKRVVLKIGAQVLLISNISETLVNGSRGRIKTFVSEDFFPHLRLLTSKVPYVLEIYNRMLEKGGVIDEDMDNEMKALLSEKDRIELVNIYRSEPRLPVVDFGLASSFKLMHPVEFAVTGPRSVAMAQRSQIPLILSWALSIHKAQGQTLDRLIVDLRNTFETGQAYVAVSRATSYDRLQVLGFKESMARVDPRVAKFYSELESK